jgi:hypothetical protein
MVIICFTSSSFSPQEIKEFPSIFTGFPSGTNNACASQISLLRIHGFTQKA